MVRRKACRHPARVHLRAGAVEYLRKPFDEQALIEAIHKAIDGQ
jgi:FixJ family two-component response regulator